MVSAASMFRKSGFNDSDAAMLAKVAASYQNVADTAVSAEDAAASIVSQIRAFGEDASFATHVIDAYNEVANRFSVGTNDLSQAMEIAASGMATYGNSFEQVIGLVTSGTEIMQGRSSQVARGLSTIASRIVKNQDALAEYGITVKNVDGSLKSTFDVLSELKPKWDSMTDAQRTALGDTIAGTNQYKVLASVMQNFGHAADATKAALESAGSAAQENSKYMESLEAKQQALKAEFEDFANRVLSKDLVGGFINAGTAMLNFANNDVGAAITRIGVLSTGVTGLVGIVGQTVGKIAEVGLQLKNLGVGGDSFLGMLASGKIALIVGGTVAAITALVEIIKAVNQAAEDRKFENLVSNYEELKQEAEEAAKNLEEVKKKLQDLQQIPEDKRGEQWHNENEELKTLLQYYEQLERVRKSQAEYAARKAYSADREVGTTVQKEIYGVTDDNEITSRFEDVGEYTSTEEAVRSLAEKTGVVLTESQIKKLDKLGDDSERAAKAVDYLKENLELLGYRFTTTTQTASEYQSTQGQLMSEFAQAANNSVRLTTAMQEQRDAYIQTNQGEYEYLSGLKTLSTEQQEFVNGYQSVLQVLVNTTDGLNDAASIVEFLGNRFGLTVDDAFSLAVAIGEVDSRAVGVKDTLVTLADGTIALASACEQADDGTWQLASGLEQLGVSGQQAGGDLSTLEGQALVLANQLLEEAGASDTAQMSLYDLTAQTIIFNDTGIDVSQKITALQNLAIQAGVTQAAIANIDTPGAVKDTGMSVEEAMKKYGMPESEAKRYVANQQKQEQTKLTEYYTQLQAEMVKSMQESRKSTASSYGGGGGSTKKDQEEVKAQTINTIEELREYLTDESTRLKLIDPDISKSDLQSTLSEVATIYQSYQDYLSQLKQQGFDETSEQYKQAEAEFAQFVEVLKTLFSEIASEGTYSVDELITYIEKNCGDLSGSISGLLDGLKDKVSSTVSSITGSIHQAFASGNANSAIAAIEEAWAMIRQMGASIEEQYDAAVQAAIKNSSAESSVADEVAEEYDRQNQLLEDKITLEEKLEALEKAKQRRMLVYSEGRFQYMQDADAISSAQKDYQETYRGIEQSQTKDLMSMLGEESKAFFEKYFSNGGDVLNYPNALRKHLLQYAQGQISGTVYEGMSEEGLYDTFGEAMKPGDAYKQILIAYNEAQAAREERRQREAELKKQIREENVRSYGVQTDFGEKIKNAQSQEEVAYWTQLRDTKQQMIKEYREAYGDEAASKYFGTDVSKQDTWASNRDLYKEAWEHQTDAWSTKPGEFKQDELGYIDQSNTPAAMHGGYEKIPADLLATEYNVADALDFEGLADQRLYDKLFSESLTKDEVQDLYDKAQYDITKGYLLNYASEMKKIGAQGYARGTRNADSGLSLVGENGPELRVLNQGDGILPSGITDNLWRWGSMTPSDMLSSLAQKAQSWAQTLNINNVTLPNVRDAQSFVSGLRELAQQYVTRRS